MTFENHFSVLYLILACYLFGSINLTFIIAKYVAGVDLRNSGSKSLGLGNFTRKMGVKWGFLLFPYEFGAKGCLPVMMGQLMGVNQSLVVLMVLSTIFGHCWPIFTKFKGGRGMLAALGGMLVFSFEIFITCLVIAGLVKYLTPIKDSAVWSLIIVLLLPLFVLIYDLQDQVYLYSFGIILLVILKRLSSNSLQELRGSMGRLNIWELVFFRLVYDRDIKDRNAWVE